ncbi:MAG TPA: hypothetical protein VKU41_06120 [Polyangiaceae bacterium]|nr:hypothetical protein [Polyangiaceae bacterium]
MKASTQFRAVLGLLLGVLLAGVAYGDESPKRPTPDYAARPPPKSTPGEVALWVPRVVFSPVYFTTEYVIRRPLGALISAAERANLPEMLYNFFAFGPEHKAGFAPIAFVDFGFNPSVGVYTFWDDAFFKGDDLRMHVSAWPEAWVGGSAVQRIRFRSDATLTLRFAGVRRPDDAFFGIGPTSLQSALSRFGEDRLEGTATTQFALWRASKVETGFGLRYARFYDGHFGGDPGIVERAGTGLFALPDGYARGYTAEYNRVHVALDSRRPFPEEGSGFRFEGTAEEGSDLSQTSGSRWVDWQAAAGGFVDLDGHRRVVSLSVQTLFSDALGTSPVPFTEQVSLGGDSAPMPGFWAGRLVDRSAAVATLRYRWPIGPWLDGSMQAALGNVFGEHLEDFQTRLLRFSGALGLEGDSSPDSNFQFLIGLGTETFDHGGQVDSFRLAFGVSRGL